MDASTLEELRLLNNINTDREQLLQLVLVGQPELRRTLSAPGLTQFVQRITSEFHINALDLEETLNYIQHRVEIAGGEPGLFSPDAIQQIYVHSKGIPRIINTLCDTALVYAYGAQDTVVSMETVEEVVADKSRGGLFPKAGNEAPTHTVHSHHNIDGLTSREIEEINNRPARGKTTADPPSNVLNALHELEAYLKRKQPSGLS